MLNSILQTLAEMLAGVTGLSSVDQIDFSHPSSLGNSGRERSLNLYLYDVRISKKMPNAGRQVERRFEGSQQFAEVNRAPSWFDVSIIITASDRTVLGEHQLLSEALLLFTRSNVLREEFLAPDLRGHGSLTLSITNDPPVDIASLWSSLSVSIRPAIYLTVTVPLSAWRKTVVPLVTEREFGASNAISTISRGEAMTRRVAIAGVVKNAFSSKPLRGVRIVIEGTEKSASSDDEGYFFFENVRSGSYALQFKRFGFVQHTCNVLVDSESLMPKEVLLEPFF